MLKLHGFVATDTIGIFASRILDNEIIQLVNSLSVAIPDSI